MVPAEKEHFVRADALQGEHISHNFQTTVATVHVVPETEEVSCGEVKAQRPNFFTEKLQVLQTKRARPIAYR